MAAAAKGFDEEGLHGGPRPAARPTASGDALRKLMTRYQAGEIEAFDELYAALAPPLGRWIGRQRLDHGADRDDLLQEAFLQIHRSRHTYIPPRPVEPWAFAIARHVYLMDRRRRHRKEGRETASEPDAPPRDDSLERRAVVRDSLRRGLAGTTRRRRAALLLHHLWGLSFAEIGRLLGVRRNTARLRSSRGARDVRDTLDGEERER